MTADARRLAMFIAASIVIAMSSSWAVLAAGVAVAALAAAHAVRRGALAVAVLGRRLRAVHGFIALLWLTVPWQWAGAALPALSPDGLMLALLASLRLQAVTLAGCALLAGMDAWALARAAAALGLPARMAGLLLLMVRYLSLLDATRQRLDRAARARGFRARANRRTLQVVAQQVSLLLVHALVRAERVQLAMRARAFSGRLPPAAGPR